MSNPDISQKSIAFLIDELVTTTIKRYYRGLNTTGADTELTFLENRKEALGKAIDGRVSNFPDASTLLGELIADLTQTLLECWHAQENVMQCGEAGDVATAAREAQSLNARRNHLMRAIDEKLGEGSISPTRKTYG